MLPPDSASDTGGTLRIQLPQASSDSFFYDGHELTIDLDTGEVLGATQWSLVPYATGHHARPFDLAKACSPQEQRALKPVPISELEDAETDKRRETP